MLSPCRWNCALTVLHSPFAWQHSATPCSASQDSLMPHSGRLDTQYFEYVVSWLVLLNAVSTQMWAVHWQYYKLPLLESTVRNHALLLKTHVCRTQSHTQAVLILNTLSTQYLGLRISMQSPCRCKLCLESTTLSLWVKAQCDTMLCFSRRSYAILILSCYSKLCSILASASQCSLHANKSCALAVLLSPFDWKHALLLKTHLCHTQSHTQDVLILNTLCT
jgi:hypothetical protein